MLNFNSHRRKGRSFIMTRKLINTVVEDGRMILETNTRRSNNDVTNDSFVVMYSNGRLRIISSDDGTECYTIHLSGRKDGQALDLSIAEIFPTLSIVSGRIPRHSIEEFRNSNKELLAADGYEPVAKSGEKEKMDTDILTAGIGIGAVITAAIAIIIGKRK